MCSSASPPTRRRWSSPRPPDRLRSASRSQATEAPRRGARDTGGRTLPITLEAERPPIGPDPGVRGPAGSDDAMPSEIALPVLGILLVALTAAGVELRAAT